MYPPTDDTKNNPDTQEKNAFSAAFEGDIPDELKSALKTIVDQFEQEEEFVRNKIVRQCKKGEDFWHGLQASIWDESAGDFRTPASLIDSSNNEDIDPSIFSKVKNIYKAHGESIISALTTGVPHVRYFPEDAENANDLQMARACSKIEELIERHNKAPLIFIRALFTLFNQHFVACYTYPKSDKSYGQTQVPVNGVQSITTSNHICPMCGAELAQTQDVSPPQEVPQVPSQMPGGMQISCPECGYQGESYVEDHTQHVPTILRYDSIDNTRQCLEIYGPLHVTVPHYCREQEQFPYLRCDGEIHYSLAKELWNHLNVQPNNDTTKYDTWARFSSDFSGSAQKGLVTVRRIWLRKSSFNTLKDTDKIDRLRTLFPDGCFVTFVNDEFAEAYNESLDDHWTVSISPLSSFVHADPIGQGLIPLNEIENEVLNIMVQSLQYGIPETYADPAVLDFDAYKQVESGPGLVFPAKPNTGQKVGDAFYTSKVATLSKEATNFTEYIEQSSQFVSGSFPSIYGGPQGGGGQTAAQYSMSRNQALQRLGLVWKMVSHWWSDSIGKAVIQYASTMSQDQKFVQRHGDSFVNVWIRAAEVEGKIGHIEPENDESFPVSWSQQREVLLDLFKMGNETIINGLLTPSNLTYLKELIGLDRLNVPGEASRIRQLEEIIILSNSEPIMGMPGNPQLGQPDIPDLSSIAPDPDLDEHEIHIDTCKLYLNSDSGLDLKKNNQAGYMNILLHMKEHIQIAQSQIAPPDDKKDPAISMSFKGDMADPMARQALAGTLAKEGIPIQITPPPIIQQNNGANGNGTNNPKSDSQSN